MPNVRKYTVISAESIETLASLVEHQIGLGWQPFGGVSAVYIPPTIEVDRGERSRTPHASKTVLYQAMIEYISINIG